jgi:beta-propeller repeat-containing protein
MCAGMHSSYLRALFCTVFLVAAVFTAASEAPQVPMSSGHRAAVSDRYGKLPVSFEANKGQTNSAVRFLSRGRGYTLFLTRSEAVLAADRADLTSRSAARQASVLRMKLAGLSSKQEPRGEEQLPGTANYFIGGDPAEWRARVPTYAKVRYSNIYSGIDLVYYGNQRQLEFDFALAPNADPGSIRLRFGEPNRLHLAANGDLVVTTANVVLAFHKPLVYQMVDGHRRPVAGDFALLGKHTMGFRLGSYDRAKALVIDPALAFSTFLGGSGFGGDSANAIAVDRAGNVYVTGQTSSIDFPVTQGAYQTVNHAAANGRTAFVTKLNPTGTALVYSTYFGGSSGSDTGSAISVDAAGNVYVAGQAYSTDFPVTPGAVQTTNRAAANDDSNAFVTKLNPTGTALVYSTYLGGSGLSGYTPYSGDKGNAIAVDAAGDAYVAGQSYSPDFPVTQGASQTTNNCAVNECANAFVSKLNPSGAALVYSTYLGGSGNAVGDNGDFANAIALDAAGNAYVTGDAFSTDFPVTPGAFQSTNPAAASESPDAFVTKLNATGTALVYSTYLGGGGAYAGNQGGAIAVDAAGNAYVAGRTTSAEFPVTQGAFQTTYPSSNDGGAAFVSKLNPAGTGLVYSTYLGGSGGVVNVTPTLAFLGGDQASGVAIDSSGNVYLTGSTASANFPVTPGAFQSTNHDQAPCGGGCIGGFNAFITELNSTGSALAYSTYLGGDGINPGDTVGVLVYGSGDTARALALDNSGNLYVAGSAVSYDFPVTGGAFQTTVNSESGNAFVTKLNMGATSTAVTPTVTVTTSASSITSAQPLTVTVTVSGGSGNPVPTGAVTLASGAYHSGAVTLSDGSAQFNIPAGALPGEPPGYASPDVLIADYLPDAASSATYNSSSGNASVYVVATFITVTPTSTSLTWAQSQSQALAVAMVATGGSGNPTPTGTVALSTGKFSSAATALSAGSATISIPPATLTTGFNILNVSYSGDSNYAALPIAGSALVTVGVVTVSVVPSASTINSTQSLTVTITVNPGSGSPTPTGMVTLVSGSYISTTTPLANGSATINIPAGSLLPGVDILEVSYGHGNYAGASGQASVTVSGTSPPAFTVTGTPVTVTPGPIAISTITVTPSGGFTGSVALTAALTSSPGGAQSVPTLSFGGTSPVSITGAAAGTATLTIGTTPANCAPGNVIDLRVRWYPPGAAALACLLLFSILRRRRNWRTTLAMLAIVVALAGGMLACGGGGSARNCPPATTAGTYTVTVTGTSGSTTATGTVAITVQ